MSDDIVKDFEGYKPNPTLWDLVNDDRELAPARTEVEDKVGALMPGDDPSEHPLHTEPNPYLHVDRSQLWDMLRSGSLTIEDERKVRGALEKQQLQHSDGRPGRPAKEAPPVKRRTY